MKKLVERFVMRLRFPYGAVVLEYDRDWLVATLRIFDSDDPDTSRAVPGRE
ncbi:hypothetical protein [Paenibacillus sp. R14(2021)]|uniref:hypothetical protein n=1 Tax=Paenibacillus sp. R14(2021) TaxID=2859228 RepID=UPI001C615C87|nr:hypothetical protein [Paenibacillus sp. R14(2021)]